MQVADLPLVFQLSGDHTPPTGAVIIRKSSLLKLEILQVRME